MLKKKSKMKAEEVEDTLGVYYWRTMKRREGCIELIL
jgi:hypothetical protein